MNLPTKEYPFVFLSACFSGTWRGKELGAHSELRVPAIRGHLRLWHRALYRYEDANRVWGSTAGNDGSGSRVGVTIKNLPAPSTAKAYTLPHKENDFHRGPRAALPAGTKATLILQRLPGCTATDWDHAQKAARFWLLGSLGYRSNRAAGSVWPDGTTAPANPAALRQELTSLGCNWAINLAPTTIGTTWELLREAASDTPNVPATYGSARPRTPSPTHFKIMRFGSELRLIIFAKDTNRLSSAKYVMAQKPMPALSKPNEWITI